MPKTSSPRLSTLPPHIVPQNISQLTTQCTRSHSRFSGGRRSKTEQPAEVAYGRPSIAEGNCPEIIAQKPPLAPVLCEPDSQQKPDLAARVLGKSLKVRMPVDHDCMRLRPHPRPTLFYVEVHHSHCPGHAPPSSSPTTQMPASPQMRLQLSENHGVIALLMASCLLTYRVYRL